MVQKWNRQTKSRDTYQTAERKGDYFSTDLNAAFLSSLKKQVTPSTQEFFWLVNEDAEPAPYKAFEKSFKNSIIL